jgi:type II secretory pathway component PulF
VPPLTEAAGHDIAWRGAAAALVAGADFARRWWHVFALGFVAAALAIWISLPAWTGRVRALFDKLPPWSLYKIQVSAGWMMSLSSMIAAGGALPAALRMLADNANAYLRDILESALRFIANGDNLGVALANTGRDFPSEEIAGDLAIYADMNGFDENLSKIAGDYLDESVRRMESISGAMNSIGILAVSVIIGWVVFGTFQMQDQIAAALT